MGWIGNIFIIAGLFLVGEKQRKAFLFTIIGELIWAVKSAYQAQWDLLFVTLIFAALAGRNWFKWGPTYAKEGSCKTRCACRKDQTEDPAG